MVRGTSPLAHQALTDPPTVKVLVVDDNPGFRESLISLLGTGDLEVVGQAGSGAEALDLVPRLEPDVVLMDLRMPLMDGITATRHLKDRYPDLGIVALTGMEDQDAVRDMLVAGASGYVLKDSDGDAILTAVLQAAAGGGVISPAVTPSVIEELTEALGRERRRAHELEVAQEALIERAARRHELISRLGHELRTPVTVILGMAQTLSRYEADPAERKEMLNRLAARAGDLAKLIERLEAAVESGLTEWADVTSVAREVAMAYDHIRIDAPRSPAMACLNRVAARRILEELMDNALAFSPDGDEVLISIRVRPDATEVRVIDHGPGVDPAVSQRIFDPLEQAESLNSRTHQGVGLGLTIARMSARAMDGDVTLENPGPGSTTFLWRLAPAG
jgi:NarL family two-component system response regulator LiaR